MWRGSKKRRNQEEKKCKIVRQNEMREKEMRGSKRRGNMKKGNETKGNRKGCT